MKRTPRCPSCRGPLKDSQRAVLLVGGTRVASPTRCCGKCCRKFGVLFVVAPPGLLAVRTAAKRVRKRSALVEAILAQEDPRQTKLFEQ